MKLFIIKTLLFLFLPVFLAIPLDIIISNRLCYIKEFPCENEVWNDIYCSNINADIAIYGSSRAWVHFNPEIIEDSLKLSCYNFGEDGSNIMLQYLRHMEYIRYNNTPKIIILSIDMWTFMRNTNTYPNFRYYPYMLWKIRIANVLELYNMNYFKKDFFLPLLRYFKNKRLLMLLLKPPKEPFFEDFEKKIELNSNGKLRYKGYRGIDLDWKDNTYNKIQSFKVDIDSSLIYLMEEFIREVRKDDIELIMVYTPEYKNGQNIIMNRKEIMSIFEKFSYNYKIPFYDYSDSLISTRKELFYNVQHLNKVGSEEFTIRLIADIKAQTYNIALKN